MRMGRRGKAVFSMCYRLLRAIWVVLALLWCICIAASFFSPTRATPILNATEGVVFGMSGSIVWRYRRERSEN